jgi:hypothetical protein
MLGPSGRRTRSPRRSSGRPPGVRPHRARWAPNTAPERRHNALPDARQTASTYRRPDVAAQEGRLLTRLRSNRRERSYWGARGIRLPKSAAVAVVGLAYRGTVDTEALARIRPALDGRLGRGATAVSLMLDSKQTTVSALRAAASGRREAGLGSSGSVINKALKALPKRPVVPRGPRKAPSHNPGPPRRCVLCGHRFPASQFAGASGTRCFGCRGARMVDTPVREVLGGAPGTRR